MATPAYAPMPAPQQAGPLEAAAVSAYRREQLINLKPVEVIRKLYDVAIGACRKGEQERARRAINELIAALDFNQGELPAGLYRLYDYCKRLLREDRNEEAAVVLEELRATWIEAFHL
jgi:flagellin-specific chaperone FliS